MGIKHFFHSWFKKKFAHHIYGLEHGQKLCDLSFEAYYEESKEQISTEKIEIDTLLLDMNGIFHTSAQKVYEYGQFKPVKRFLSKQYRKKVGGLQAQLELFKDICATIDHLVQTIQPKKRLVMCIDGPAPLSKQAQQRQRRFLAAREKKSPGTFDSNVITPGTPMMDYLSKYIDWYLRKRISENAFPEIEIVFSNEKVPGEGEHKLINFVRSFGTEQETYCLYGMDADLIMLALATQKPNFYILREETGTLQFPAEFEFLLIDIGQVRTELYELMRWKDSKYIADIESVINDFVLMCFTVGNDFLPHIPAMEIISGSIDYMIEVYKEVCSSFGHLTKKGKNGIRFSRKTLEVFLGTMSKYEKTVLEGKLKRPEKYFADPILENNVVQTEQGEELDIEVYRKEYLTTKFTDLDLERVCHAYLEGMQWVLTYYTQGVSNWKWRYPYHYAPFAHTIAQHVKTFKFPEYTVTTPTVPFIQLLCVLPPASCGFLPKPLDSLLRDGMEKYCPEEFEIDLAGKRQEWEGTALLPLVDYAEVEKMYFQRLKQVEEKDRRRNQLGKSFIYRPSDRSMEFKSFYGDFRSCVVTEPIEL